MESISVSGIEGLSSYAAISQFTASPVGNPNWKIGVTAAIVPKVTADLPVKPIPFGLNWDHLSDISLFDPASDEPGHIDALLGIDVFIGCLLKGQLAGPPGSPTAFETVFGCVLGGLINSSTCNTSHNSVSCLNDAICRFWEIKEPPSDKLACSMEGHAVIQHFQDKHYRTPLARFVVPLPRKLNIASIGELKSQAIRRFLALERNLNSKGKFSEVESVMLEYLKLGHAEEVPIKDFDKPTDKVFYLPMSVVYKDSCTTTKIRAVFDASAKSMSGVSLNDTLLVGPTVHPPLLDVLSRFRCFRIPLSTDVSKMYRAIELENEGKNSHRYVWQSSPNDMIRD
uniref:Peptidase aspartic putative domain-containing protein n=1 Tax=Amphimedon queenslandica TaxID=400682 RepID=A0A1X7VJB4_AMPQE